MSKPMHYMRLGDTVQIRKSRNVWPWFRPDEFVTLTLASPDLVLAYNQGDLEYVLAHSEAK